MLRNRAKIGPYVLIRKLGEGGFGVVWLAKRGTRIAMQFALKFPKDASINVKEIMREAKSWKAAAGHPNVLPLIEAELYDGRLVLVSEYAEDGSLTNWLKEHGGRAPGLEEAVETAEGILDGLAYLHAKNIIHRDLKPDNIMLQGGRPRLTDFGLARDLNAYNSSMVAGTPLYMAPEAFDKERTAQVDIWSAGVILYEMLTGQTPFLATTLPELIAQIRNEQPAPPPFPLPPALLQIVHRALEKDPGRRFQTAGEMRAALRKTRLTLPDVGATLPDALLKRVEFVVKKWWAHTLVVLLLGLTGSLAYRYYNPAASPEGPGVYPNEPAVINSNNVNQGGSPTPQTTRSPPGPGRTPRPTPSPAAPPKPTPATPATEPKPAEVALPKDPSWKEVEQVARTAYAGRTIARVEQSSDLRCGDGKCQQKVYVVLKNSGGDETKKLVSVSFQLEGGKYVGIAKRLD
jgi:serine/threonine-protein kinase